MQNLYSEGPLSVVTMDKQTDDTRCEETEILIYNLGHPGQWKEMKADLCPLYLTRPCAIIMTLTANQSVKIKRCLRFEPLQISPNPHSLLPASPAMQDSGSR